MHIAIIWQRFLPYHIARIKHLSGRLSPLGHRLSAIEVASQDVSYGFPVTEIDDNDNGFKHICCFPEESYHKLGGKQIHKKVLNTLEGLQPDIVFAPATAFPEGMAAYAYRLYFGKKAVMMDDAWEYTDRRHFPTRIVKRMIHRNIDLAFIPGDSHLPYFTEMGFPEDRLLFGIQAIDNDYFREEAERARMDEITHRNLHSLPSDYFLYVGRFLPRKGLDTLIEAYSNYRKHAGITSWNLVLVGDGDYVDHIKKLARYLPEVYFAGPKFGAELCLYYGLARMLIAPSLSDPWGLVVNEGMASGLPVIVSRGCGAAKTLVQEGENGWTFEPGDDEALTKLMVQASSLSLDCLKEMGRKSQSIVSEWSLDRFADGVLKAIEIPRRPPAGFISDALTRLWKGQIKIN
ncbi:MAG: glycosyltransferase family 4 protein [Thermodesulfobacteriota bacterium]